MIGLVQLKIVPAVLIPLALMMSLNANALLLDCSKSPNTHLAPDAQCKSAEYVTHASPVTALKEAIPVVAPAVIATGGGFQLNQTRASDAATGSAPLLVLICALVGVILIRAKSYNSK